ASLFCDRAVDQSMQRSFTYDIHVCRKRMVCEFNCRLLGRRKSIPIQTDARDLHLLDVYEEGNAIEAVAHTIVKDRHDSEHDRQYPTTDPTRPRAADATESKRQKHANDEDDSACDPVLATDLIKELYASL